MPTAMSLQSFLAHAIKLEHEAETIYRKSAEIINAIEMPDSAAFFLEMAGYAKRHLEEIMRRAGLTEMPELPPLAYVWGNNPAPETITPAPTAGSCLNLDEAMALALSAERRAEAFYAEVAATSPAAEVRALAEAFAAEEREHVLALERFMGSKPY